MPWIVKYKKLTEKQKSEVLELFYFKQVQINDLAEIYKTSYYAISKIISEDLKQKHP